MKCLFCFHLVFWTLFGLISLPEAEALSWKRKPISKSVAKGGRVTFYCEINDRNGASVVWNRGTTAISSNSQVQNAFSRYSIAGEFNLVINNVQEEDNESFTCNVFNLGAVSATLTVLLPPEPPVIIRNVTGNPYRENQVVKFTCESKGGNPVPTMKWFKNGQEIVNVIYRPASAIGETSSCDTIATLDSSDHQANYSCIVYNAANENSPVTASTVLQVQYSPFITFAPYNPYNILLGQNAQLECTVDSNPTVSSVTWSHNGQNLPNRDIKLTFTPVRKTDSGNYTCTANNGIGGPRQKIVTLNAVYPPEIQVPGSKTYREGDEINIECVVDANPEPYQIQWEKVSGNQSTNIPQGSKLLINSATRQDAGNYTCKAFSQLRVSGQSNQPMVRQAYSYIHIQFGPGEAFISPVSDVEVGKPLEIKCSARPDGYPAATYEWKKDNSVLQQTSSTYKINSAELSDNGLYTCTPINTVSRGKSNQININVNEPPKIITRPATAITLAITQSEMVTISCTARGRPAPVIHWFKDDSDTPVTQTDSAYYTITSKDVTFEKYSTEVTSTLQFKGQGRTSSNSQETKLRIEDMGVYHCRVMSAVYTEPIKASQTLNLQFRPVVSTDQVRTAVNLSSPASLPCTAQAFPKPSFQWYYKGTEIFNSQARYSVKEVEIPGISKYSSVLTVDSVNQADLGLYNCFVSNNLGNVSQTVHLTVKTVPEAPVKLRSTGQRWDSAVFQWDAGFDGGFEQQYMIQYSTGGEDKTQVVSPPTSTTYNLTKLRPDTTYSIVVFGKNRLGNGELSTPLIVKTSALSIPSIGPSIDFNVQSGVLDIEQEVTANYCLRVSVRYKNKGSNWDVIYQCLEFLGKTVELQESNIAALNISVCLKDRQDVCGDPVSAKLSEEGETTLTEQDVYIIASVCGVIIVTLLIILVIFICRRRRNQAKYEENKTTTELRAQPVNGVSSSPNKKPQVYENQGMSYLPGVDLDDPVPPSSTNVYSLCYPDSISNNTNHNFSNSYGPLDLKHNHGNGHLANGHHANGHLANGHVTGNGSIPHGGHDTSYDSQIDKRVFENEMNRRNEYSTRVDYNNRHGDLHFHGMPNTKPKDQYLDLEEKKDGSLPSNPESGYSTPDPAKPKKVIYEVVV